MINKKYIIKNNNNNLLKLLFKSKNLYGESIKKLNKDITPYLYGIRHKYSIIDLNILIINLKRVFKLIKNILNKKDNKILIIGNFNEIKFLINKQFVKNNKNLIFLNKELINGFISNKKLNFFLNLKKIQLVLILKSSMDDIYLNKELSLLNIPVVSFINTDQSLKKIDYPLITNTKNIKSIFILMFLLRKIF